MAITTQPELLSEWGVVHREGRCSNCSRLAWHCSHVRAGRQAGQVQRAEEAADSGARARTGTQGQYMSVSDLDAQVAARLDPADRSRCRADCVSRLPVPEHFSGDDAVKQVYTEQVEGTSTIPKHCTPKRTDTCCPECGCCSWGAAEPECDGKGAEYPAGRVYMMSAVLLERKFYVQRCTTPACRGVLTVDGQEYGILRKTHLVAFSYELLYGFDLMMGRHCPTFSGYWKDAMHRAPLPEQHRQWCIENHKTVFLEAYWCFVALMDIDYVESFSCNCPLDWVFDGIAIGPRRSNTCLMVAWAAAPSNATVGGAAYQQRMFIKAKATRDLLFNMGARGEISAEDYQQLRAGLVQVTSRTPRGDVEGAAEAEWVVLALLDKCFRPQGADVWKCPRDWKLLLQAIGSSAPACQLAKPSVWALLGRVAAGGILGLADAGKLAAKAPSLAAFLASHAGEVHAAHGYPPYVQELVARMLHVAQAAYQERSVPRPDGEERRQRECDNRVLLDGTVQMGSTRPEQWTLEESFLRTGVWCPGSATKDNWEASGLGGSHVQRRLRAYTADLPLPSRQHHRLCQSVTER